MASPSKAEVEELIRVAVGESKADIDARFGYLLGERISREQAEATLGQIISEARAEFVGTSSRIDELCTQFTGQFIEHRNVIEKIVNDFKETSASLTASVDAAREETSVLEAHNKSVGLKLDVAFAEQTAKTTSVRDEVEVGCRCEGHSDDDEQGGGGSMDRGKGSRTSQRWQRTKH